MDEAAVRQRAEALCEALVAGDVDRAITELSDELRRNVGEVLALLPLPVQEATVESVDRAGAGYSVLIRLVGETDEIELQTRWKDRGDSPRVVEASHLSRTARAREPVETEPSGEEPAG